MDTPLLFSEKRSSAWLLTVYLLFYAWSHLFEIVDSGHVVAWLSFGYLAGCLIRLPYNRWAVFLLGVAIINTIGPELLGDAQWISGAANAVGHLVAATVGAGLYRRYGGNTTGFSSIRDIGLFAGSVLIAGPVLGSALEALLETALRPDDPLFWHWSVSQGSMFIGAIYLTPLVLIDGKIRAMARESYTRAGMGFEHGGYLLIPLLILVVIWMDPGFFAAPFLSFVYAAVISMTLAAIRFGVWGALSTGIWAGFLSGHATRFELLDYLLVPLSDHVMIQQQALVAGALLVSYLIGVVIWGARQEQNRALRAASEFEMLVDSTPLGLFVSDLSELKKWMDAHLDGSSLSARVFLSEAFDELLDRLVDAPVVVSNAILDLYGFESRDEFLRNQRWLLEKAGKERLVDLYAHLYDHPDKPYVFDRNRTQEDGTLGQFHIVHWLMPDKAERTWNRVVTAVEDRTALQTSLGLVSSLRKEKEDLADLLLETEKSARIGSWYWNFETNDISWSPEMYRINGLDPSEIEPLTIENSLGRLHPADRQWVLKSFEADSLDHVLRFRLLLPDGEVRWIQSEGSTRYDDAGKAVGLQGFQRDITDLVRSDRAKQNAADIIETTSSIVYLASGIERRRIRFVSKAIEELGWSADSILASDLLLFHYANTDDARHVRSMLRSLEPSSGHVSLEYQLRTPTGIRWFRDHVRRIPSETGEEMLFEGVLIDITGQKRTGELLELEEGRRKALEDLSLDGAQPVDEVAYLQHAETYLESLTGSTISFMHFCDPSSDSVQLEGAWSKRTLDGFCNAVYLSHYPVSKAGIWADAIRKKSAVIVNDYPAVAREGALPAGHAPVHRFLAYPVMDDDEVVLVAGVGNALEPYDETDIDSVAIVAREVWHRVKANRLRTQIAESEQRMRRFFDQAYDSLLYYQATDGGRRFIITDLNREAEAAGGKPRDLVVGRDIREAYPNADPAILDVLYQVWSTGEAVIKDEVHYHANGIDYWHDMHAIRLPDMTVAVAWRDVTRSVQARRETEQLHRQLESRSRMEALGRLAGGVAHDFNNLLGVIIGHAEAAQYASKSLEETSEHLRGIVSTAKRSTELTKQLLALARRQVGTPRILRVQDHIVRLMEVIGRLIGENVDVTVDLPDEPIAIRLDPTHLDQVVTNLCMNAQEAIREEGHIRIAVDVLPAYQLPDDRDEDCDACTFVRIRVEDDGIGMDEETLAHIFEPFFSLKESGTGLGLATVYGIVRQNKGHMDVHSEKGVGTTLSVYFPLVDVAEPDAAVA